MRLRTKYATVAATIGVAAGFLMVTPGAANAAEYGCSGSLIGTWAVKSQVPNTLSHVRLYYDSSTGYNCAVNVKDAYYTQFDDYISISIRRQDWTEDGNNRPGVTIDSDAGNYYHYAGPVRIPAKGMCVSIDALSSYGSIEDESGAVNTGPVACG